MKCKTKLVILLLYYVLSTYNSLPKKGELFKNFGEGKNLVIS